MKVGVTVTCSVCGQMKNPVGRSAPLGTSYCEPRWYGSPGGCEGYYREPFPGSLWPGETEAEFGYPVGRNGTVEQ